MQYTFLLYSDHSGRDQATPEQQSQELAVFGAYIGALQEAGVFVSTDWLSPVETAKTVTMVDGELVVHDGPFAETHEQLGGTFVIDAPDLDVALAWAKQCPIAFFGKVEVRSSAMGG